MIYPHIRIVGKIRNQAYVEAFGRHIKSLRNAKGVSRETLAAHANIETMQIYRIETGRVNTTISTLFAIAKALDVRPQELLHFEFHQE